MRFVEVTGRLTSIPVRAASDPSLTGKTLVQANPGLVGIRIWQTLYGGYSWSIVYDPGRPNYTPEDVKLFVGYTATYMKAGLASSKNQKIYVDGGPWQTMLQAEQACQNVWRQLRSLN